MATLTGELISETYDSLLKVTDNNTITGIKKRITDGFGNDIPLLLSSTDLEIDGTLILSALTDLAPASKFLSLKADNSVGFRTSSELLSDIGGASSSSISGTTGRLSKFTSSGTVGNSILNEIGNVIHLTDGTSSYASFGINNPGIDNDAYIGSTINNDFLIKVNNTEALRIDTAFRLKIANIQNALGDTDKFLVSEDGVVKYRTGDELRADIGAGVGSVTSVGLTMPVAFSVANSPITSAGTLEVTAVGTASQYIRGDGQLATLPTGAGGGSAVNYYLNGSVASGVAGYQQMDNTAIIGTGTDFTLVGNGLIAQFLTDAGNPNRLLIPGGAWNLEMFFQVSSSGGNAKFYVDLFKYDGTTFTSIASGVTNPEEITGGTSIDLYLTSLGVPETALLITDRLAIRVYIVDNSGGRTVTLHTEDNTLCQVTTTFAGGISALNGLTANTQYFAVGTSGTDFNISSLVDTHTFNLPTASTTKRGALSASDWNTFNNKQPAGNYVTLDTNQTIAGEKTFTAGNIFIDSRSYFAEDNGQSGQAGYTQMITLADSFSFINGATTKAAQFIYGGGVRSYTLPSANGTLALTSALSDYVTLATTQTITGAKTFTSQLTVSTNNASIVIKPDNSSTGGILWKNSINDSHWSIQSNISAVGAQGTLSFSNDILGQNAFSVAPLTNIVTFTVDAVVNGLTVGHGGGNLGSNTVVGFESLFSNTTGENNTGNGIQSLFSNTTGIQNSAFGASSLLYNTTGDLNSSFGSVSLRDNTSGSSNSSFGAFSLLSNTTGYGNIAMGYYAGAFTNSGASNLTSNNSVYLGSDTSSSASGNTNEIVIGYSARGGGSNSATLGNSSIATTNLRGKVGIGYTTNPSLYDLDVNGTLRVAGAATFSSSVTATKYNIIPDSTNQLYNVVDATNTYAGSYAFQAGKGSAGFGGAIIAYGHSHASKAGWITAGISSASGGKFSVNTQGLGNGTDVFVVQQDGNVGIGTTTPLMRLDVVGNVSNTTVISGTTVQLVSVMRASNDVGSIRSAFDTTNGNAFLYSGQSGSSLNFGTRAAPNNNTVMTLTSGGNVGIGTTTPSYQLQLSTDSAAKPTSALWTIASDERIKENISPYTKGLDVLMSINPVTYDYNGLGGFKKGKGGVGIIAQEIMNILPDSVNSVKGKLKETDKEEIDILNFNGHELTYVLINAIKEQQAQIEELKLLIQNK